MYDFLAELFVYLFALLYAALFVIIAQRWLRTNFSGTQKKRRSAPKRPPSDPIRL